MLRRQSFVITVQWQLMRWEMFLHSPSKKFGWSPGWEYQTSIRLLTTPASCLPSLSPRYLCACRSHKQPDGIHLAYPQDNKTATQNYFLLKQNMIQSVFKWRILSGRIILLLKQNLKILKLPLRIRCMLWASVWDVWLKSFSGKVGTNRASRGAQW